MAEITTPLTYRQAPNTKMRSNDRHIYSLLRYMPPGDNLCSLILCQFPLCGSKGLCGDFVGKLILVYHHTRKPKATYAFSVNSALLTFTVLVFHVHDSRDPVGWTRNTSIYGQVYECRLQDRYGVHSVITVYTQSEGGDPQTTESSPPPPPLPPPLVLPGELGDGAVEDGEGSPPTLLPPHSPIKPPAKVRYYYSVSCIYM